MSLDALKSQGEIEAAVCDAVARFQQEFMGRGPRHVHTHLIENKLFVHLEGVLTLGSAAGAPTGAFRGADQPSALDEPLRPWVVVAVRDEDDPDFGARAQGALDQPACSERLVVGMGREDRYPPAGPELVLQIGRAHV